jgi:serine/threonine-protein kinase HipA
MAFNVLAHNRDDHVKNVSYLMGRRGEWLLSPAYDLVFSEGPGGRHTMAVAGEDDRPTQRDMLRVAESCGVDPKRARAMIERVADAVSRWRDFAAETGVTEETTREIALRLSSISVR